jgi:hypothetical protein
MGNPFQQKARQRKVVYLALIVLLFTVSLLHRRLVVERQAEDLQLREVSRGEVELTSSAVRLSLTGSRGLATTILWSAAIDKMTKHEWNELELLVGSITKLQPYFITPWLFQSWNMAFNVAVECDRPRDKYYYVSRGLELLAEGERRNQGTLDDTATPDGRPKFPGHPELRHNMGFTYQLKIGNSDERTIMRSLLDLSCIDPLKRDPKDFITANDRGQSVVRDAEFARFCQENPRLVRRLREQVGLATPRQVVKFLEDNRDVPSRFKKTPPSPGQRESELEIPRRQFPILPSARVKQNWPDPQSYQLTREAIGIFLICRTWYQYAQEPLPPPLPDPGVPEREAEWGRKFDRLHYRMPKAMAVQIFRSYPSRAQAYIGEVLEEEGWFDEDGWVIRDWFDVGPGADETELRVGTDAKYHAGPAWQRAYEMYKEYGLENGLYIPPTQLAALEAKAQIARDALKITRNEIGTLRSDVRARLGDTYDAHVKLFWASTYRHMTNFDAHLGQADAERTPEMVMARKLIHRAESLRKANDYQALGVYEEAWPTLVYSFLQHPKFAKLSNVQEDVYEPELRYLRLSQEARKDVFRNVVLGMAQMSAWPHPNWEKWGWVNSSQKAKIMPIRMARGPLEGVLYYDGDHADELRQATLGVLLGARMASAPGTLPPVPVPGAMHLVLAGGTRRSPDVPTGWRYLIDDDSIHSVRDRLGLPKYEKK